MSDKVSQVILQGPRSYQEDCYLILEFPEFPGGTLLAVMDGHRGPSVAEYCRAKIPLLFNPKESRRDPRKALYDLVENINKETRQMNEGSTLSVVWLCDDVATVAFLGDSPVIIVDANGSINISGEHNVRSNQKEREAAVARGGYCNGGYLYHPNGSGLQLSRALGNACMGDIISREPEIYSVFLGPNSIIIICSDGLLDPAHASTNALAHKAVEIVRDGGDAEALSKWAEERGLDDNVAVIVWRRA